MPRKPKPKNTLSAGERAALYEAEQAEKRAKEAGRARRGGRSGVEETMGGESQ